MERFLNKDHRKFPEFLHYIRDIFHRCRETEETEEKMVSEEPSHEEVHLKLKEKYGKRVKSLGKGSFATCFMVKRESDGKLFAVKKLKKKPPETQMAYTRRLVREFRIGSLMHHPNIVETLDMFVEKGVAYEVMELCEGGDLFSEIEDKILTQDEQHCIFLQLLHGVQYLHHHFISHRDLKPENCVFDTHNYLKIIDFGSACVYHDDPAHLCFEKFGTGPYMAPEIHLQHGYDGRKADIWSLAIVYLVIHSKVFPWGKATADDKRYLKYLEADGQCRVIEDLEDEKRKEIIRNMLNPDPGKRPTIDQVLGSSWIKSIIECDHQNLQKSFHHHGHASAKFIKEE